MDLSRLEILKQKLERATDFRVVLNYFLDHFGDHDRFLKLGRKVDDPLLEALIEAAGESVLGRPVRLGPKVLILVPDHHFIHGAFELAGYPASVLYFRELGKGMLALMGVEPGGVVHYVRFTAEVVPDTWGASRRRAAAGRGNRFRSN